MRLLKDDMVRAGTDTPLELFRQGIRAEKTREKYTRTLHQVTCGFLEDLLDGTFEERVSQLVLYGREKPDWTRDLLISLSRKLRERTQLDKNDEDYLNPATFANYFKPIKKLFDMNYIAMPWKRVYATYPELDNMPDTTGWTRDEIARILLHARSTQERATILVLASSGVRSGALPLLNWGNLKPVYGTDGKLTMDPSEGELVCASLEIYSGSKESYIAFITPEAFNTLQEYGRTCAEVLGRPAHAKDPIFTVTKAGMLVRASYRSIEKRVRRMARDAGLREKKSGKRHPVPLMNGFRRFFNKTCKGATSGDSTISSLIKKEFMMGHRGLTALDENYFKTDVLELAAEYMTAVPSLTIDNSDRLRQSNRVMKSNIQKLEGGKDEKLERLTRDMNEMRKEREDMRQERDSMRQEIFELKQQRELPATDLLNLLKEESSSDDMPQDVLQSLTGMIQQLAAAQDSALQNMQRKHDMEIENIKRALGQSPDE